MAETEHDLLVEAVDAWPEFDDPDEPVNGGDLVEWFGEWRKRAKKVIREEDEPDEDEDEEDNS